MGLLDCHYVGDLNSGFLYRLRRNLFHHRTDFAPVAVLMDVDMTWFAILIAMNLQTSFLTPPSGLVCSI